MKLDAASSEDFLSSYNRIDLRIAKLKSIIQSRTNIVLKGIFNQVNYDLILCYIPCAGEPTTEEFFHTL